MKYDPKKTLFYYDVNLEEYREAAYPALHTILYQYDGDSEEYKIVDAKEDGFKMSLDQCEDKLNKILKPDNEKTKEDNVNHPKHYEGSCSIECIDAMRFALGDEGLAYFCAGNAFKYLWRYKFKNGKEDLDKAWWYFNKLRYLRGNISNPTIRLLHERVMNLYLTVTGKEESAAFEDEEEENDD